MTTTDNRHREPTAAERLERSHRIPLVATCVFVLTMLAIWLMGRQLGGHYVPAEHGDGVEWVRSE